MGHRLEVKDLVLRYGRSGFTLQADHVAFPPGVHFLVGRNGAGKSSLLRVLAGLERPAKGEITLDGVHVSGRDTWRAYRAASGYLHQDFAVRGRASVRAFARYGAWLRGVPNADLGARTDDVLETVGLTATAAQRASRLSGGMQRRLGLAVEMSNRPFVYLLDEPSSGLDYEARAAVHAVVERALESGAVVVVASHDDAELNRYSDATYHLVRDGWVSTSPAASGDVTVEHLLGGDR